MFNIRLRRSRGLCTLQWVDGAQGAGLQVVSARTVDLGRQADLFGLFGSVRADQSASFESMQERLNTFMGLIQKDPAVAHVIGYTGGRSRNTAVMFITLKPLAERKLSADQVINRLRGKLAQEPGATLFTRILSLASCCAIALARLISAAFTAL